MDSIAKKLSKLEKRMNRLECTLMHQEQWIEALKEIVENTIFQHLKTSCWANAVLQILLQAVIFDHGKNSARCNRLLDLVKEHAMDLFDGSAPETMQYSKRGEVEKFYNDNIKELKENVNAIKADKPMPEA